MSEFLDVSNYNHPVLFVLSIPFLLLAWVFLIIGGCFGFIAIAIGRRPSMNNLYKFKELL